MASNSYTGYLRPMGYGELLEDLLKLNEVFGDIVCIKARGSSVSGRALPLVKIGNGSKKLLALASVHGREAVTTAFLMRSAFELLREDNREILSKVTIYLCPMANPDGVEIFLGREKPVAQVNGLEQRLYKNNANNVNLNANFPYCFSCVPKSRQGGVCAASEPETKAIMSLCESVDFDSALSLHARGNCIFWRDFGNGEIKGDFCLSKTLSKGCGFDLVSPTRKVQDYSGGFENWFRFRFRRPALCVELVRDEKIPFYNMFENFDQAVLWEHTGKLFSTWAKAECR